MHAGLVALRLHLSGIEPQFTCLTIEPQWSLPLNFSMEFFMKFLIAGCTCPILFRQSLLDAPPLLVVGVPARSWLRALFSVRRPSRDWWRTCPLLVRGRARPSRRRAPC